MKNNKGFLVTLAFALVLLFSGSMAFGQESAEAATVNQIKLSVTGMHCGGCAAKEKAFLEGIEGVQSAEVDYETNTALVVVDPAAVTRQTLGSSLADSPFAATVVDNTVEEGQSNCNGAAKKAGCCAGGESAGKKCSKKKSEAAEN